MSNENAPEDTRKQALSECLERYKRAASAHLYEFDIRTVDVVFGFQKVLHKRTRSLAKAMSIRAKLIRDLGAFISPSVRIEAISFFTDGELRYSREAGPLK